jgi:hypothetical protein
VRVVVNANVFDWKEFCRTLCKNYKNKNLNQQLHSLKYLEIFKNKMRTFLKEISQYCRQYTIISEKLVKTEKLQKTLRSVWFFQRLLEKFSEKLAIRCSLNENDENKMRFENLIEQTLQLIKSRSIIIKTRKTDYKTKKTTALMKEMKSIMKKASTSISSICWKQWNLESKNRSQKLMSNSTIWSKSWKKWRSTLTIW